MRLSSAVALYLRAHKHLYAKETLRLRRHVLENFVVFCNDEQVRHITARHVIAWIESFDVSASTMRVRVGTVRVLWHWMIIKEYVRTDITIGVKVPRQPRGVPRSLSVEDVARLSEALPDARARLAIALMVNEGLRRAEVAQLEMADLDLGSNTMRIVGKGGHVATMPITASTRRFLDEYLGERGRRGGPVLQSQVRVGGIAPDTLGRLVTRWMRDAGVKHSGRDGRSAHALRHTMCETLYARGVDLRTIADAARHASPKTTWIYLRHTSTVDTLREVLGADEIDQALRGVSDADRVRSP